MIKVNINLLNIFYLKVKKKSIEYEGKNVSDIISQFLEQYKEKFDDNMLSRNKKKLNEQMIILLNGRNIKSLKNYKTRLNNGDELYLSYPLSGG